ncbi:MAG TPA: MBL fold metallo-hydrolase [Thermoanaerobaculia bacterium]|nr:MBL fold metallo-hydrolase [Thermoanaerobaculia bacterium]
MASLLERLPTNVDGDFYVDESCIDCDACRQIAPSVFGRVGGQSAVRQQPRTEAELLEANKALLACPTASIGSVVKHPMAAALEAYPERIEGEVYRCGFTSESSFGAFSYLARTAKGNLLIDSPRFSGPIVRNIERLGGAGWMLLTHADDVADHKKFHSRFGSRRLLHRDDVRRATSMIEVQPEGREPRAVAPDTLMIPVPGHTAGHVVFLHRERFLFSGDHLAWDAPRGRLYAFRNACWYSWEEQTRSMESLLDYRFEWVLPGHGRPIHLPAARMREELEKCVDWMKRN